MKKIILVQPEKPENTGLIARLTANYEASLRIVNPQFNLSEARKTANKYQNKLRNTEIYDSVQEAVQDLEFVVGTKPGEGSPLKQFQPRENMSIMIGRESSGLTNQELKHCDTTVHIETGKHPSLNQSHATAVILHQFHKKEEAKTDVDKLQAVKEDVGQVTMKLLKRSSPSIQEINALIAEIKEN